MNIKTKLQNQLYIYLYISISIYLYIYIYLYLYLYIYIYIYYLWFIWWFHRIPFHTSDHKRSHESKIFAKRFSSWGIDRNITKTSCHSRLFLVLHLLVNTVIIMAIARKGVERVFILIQFFSCLIKWGLLFRLGVLKRNHPCVRLNGLFDFCIPWNCQKIIDFLMVLI